VISSLIPLSFSSLLFLISFEIQFTCSQTEEMTWKRV
jgi:hypothetical protein